MKTRTVGIKQTSLGVYRLTFNGTVLGDSRGYSRDEAIQEAKKFVARDGGVDGDWQGSTWVEFRNILDPELETKMTVATIDIADLKVEFHADPAAAQVKADKQDLLYVGKPEDLGDLTGPQMVALYNMTAKELNTGIQPVNRFSNKEAGIKRLMANIHDLWELRRTEEKARLERLEASAKNKPVKVTKKAATPARRGSGINLAPMKKAYACREGSKQALMVDLLSRPQGATMKELLAALSGGAKPWKEVTVKSGLNWDMNKVKGYGIRTRKRFDEDCYHLVLPSGMDRPLPHTPKKGA